MKGSKIYIGQQYNDGSCFPVALYNCGVYLNHPMDLKEYIKLCNSENGGTTYKDEIIAINKFGKLVHTNSYADIIQHGGIVTIRHHEGLHSAFVRPSKFLRKDKITVINSWLGPVEYEISIFRLRKCLSSMNMWKITQK